VSTSAVSPFERTFPTVFAETVKDLVDDAPLTPLLRRLCARLSAQLAPTSIGLVRFAEDGTDDVVISPPAGPLQDTREVHDTDVTAWGRVSASAPTGGRVDEDDLDAVAEFMDWLIERHRTRRRRLDNIDRERQLIAGQLHDDSIQAMTAISLNLQRLVRTDVIAQEQVQHLLHLTNDAIERLRHMMFALHPPTLATDGLVASLDDYLDAFIAPTGLRTVITGDVTRRITAGIEALAFRLARAAVHNSWKHAQAATIEVAVEYPGATVRVTVRDDGVGFDPSLIGHRDVGHAGIEYSRDLAAEVGGTYELVSAPGAGTTVTIELPVT
jgi:signal transduction histidine kinase